MTGKERESNANAVEREFGTVSPGLLGSCEVCQQANCDMTPREFYNAVHETQTVFDEGGFSRSSCELCGSHLGGDRYAAHSINKQHEIIHFDVCVDCLMSTANGEEYPDE